MATFEMSSTEVRANFADVVGRAQHGGVVTAITKAGRRVAAVVPPELLDLLEDLEDRGLVRMAHEVKEQGNGTVDHASLLAEFGLR